MTSRQPLDSEEEEIVCGRGACNINGNSGEEIADARAKQKLIPVNRAVGVKNRLPGDEFFHAAFPFREALAQAQRGAQKKTPTEKRAQRWPLRAVPK